MTEIENVYGTADREEIEQLQLERLQTVLHRVYKNVEFYKRSFHDCDFSPDDLTDFGSLHKLPTTGRNTLVENHPYDMFAVPLREIIRLQSTSPVAGETIVVGFTRNDVEHWTELAARSLQSSGVGRDDLVQIYVDYGKFPGALGLHYGAERIGASVIPSSNMSVDVEFEMMRNYHTTALVTTPHRALRLADHIRDHDVSAKALRLRACLLVGQYWSESIRKRIEEVLYSPVFDCYGHSEIVPSGIAAECAERSGMHINEDHFVAEIVDPATGAVLPPGEEGELVITTLTKEAFPLIRYRTGDITRLNYETCGCGRTFVRMDRVSSRTDNMLFVGGVRLFPSQVEHIISHAFGEKISPPVFELMVEGSGTEDSVDVAIEINEAIFSDELRVLKAIQEKIRGELFDALGVPARVRFVEPGRLDAGSENKSRVVDRREVD